MDPLTAKELSLLEQNKNKIHGSIIYDFIVHSIKGKYVCEQERQKFTTSRFVSGDLPGPKLIEPHAMGLINCYSQMTRQTKEKCEEKYRNIVNCLEVNNGTLYDFPVKCVPQMEDFLNC